MAEKYEYKVDCFGCVFSGKKTFAKQLQDAINRRAAEGWKLHSYETPGAFGEFCTLVFYREVE